MLTHLDLFSGIGGFSLAFEREGFTTIGFAEIDPFACAVLKKHWPNVKNYGDVRNISNIHRHISVITGGFPCQDVSLANQNAEGLSGKRSSYWFWLLEIIKRNRPDFCLIENVPALRARGGERVLIGLEKAGYTARPFLVEARQVGADHIRERVWIFAYSRSIRRKGLFSGSYSGTSGQGRACGSSGFTTKDWRTRPIFGGSTAPILCRGTDGVPNRMDRVKCLGNSIVPQVAQLFARFIKGIQANVNGYEDKVISESQGCITIGA